jgi:hypothetical protein
MWYNRRRMARRGVVAMFLLFVVAQIAAGALFATVCTEPCPDDVGRSTCPPICSVCTVCTHAQQAIVQTPGAGAVMPLPVIASVFTPHRSGTTPQRADDIFHVPLPG